MKLALSWDIPLCRPHIKEILGWKYRLHVQGRMSAEKETSLLALHCAVGQKVATIINTAMGNSYPKKRKNLHTLYCHSFL
jgi:hypothetical protein